MTETISVSENVVTTTGTTSTTPRFTLADSVLTTFTSTPIEQRFLNVPLMVEESKVALMRMLPEAALQGQPKKRGREEMYSVSESGVALIQLRGVLVNESNPYLSYYGYGSYPDFQESMQAASEDSAVQAILMVIDSPGGDTSGAFESADSVRAAVVHKPVYAVAADHMFSAAYLIGSQADRIFVNRMSGVGSVGVITMHADVSKMLDKMGVDVTLLHAGKHKTDGSPFKPLSEQARMSLQGEIDRRYEMFVDYVAAGRKMSSQAVQKTEAGLFFSTNGIAVGFADEAGTPFDAHQRILGDSRLKPSSVAVSYAVTGGVEMESTNQQAVGETTTTQATSQVTYEQAVEISNLCAIAGKPQLVNGFLAARTPVADVQRQLLDQRAQETERNPISSHSSTHGGGSEEDPGERVLMAATDKLVVSMKEQVNGRR